MTFPFGRWMTRKFCRMAGHLGPAINELLLGLCPSAKGSRLPRLRQTRSRAALLCSTSSSTAGREQGVTCRPRLLTRGPAARCKSRRRRWSPTCCSRNLRLHQVQRLQVLVMVCVFSVTAAGEAVQKAAPHVRGGHSLLCRRLLLRVLKAWSRLAGHFGAWGRCCSDRETGGCGQR